MSKTNRTRCDSRQLTLYCFEELSAGERREVQEHLRQCPDCLRTVEEVERSLRAAAAEEVHLADRDVRAFTERVKDRVGRRRSFGVWPSALGGGAVAAVLALTLVASPTPQTSLPPSDASVLQGLTLAEEVELLNHLELLEDLDLFQKLVEGQG